MCVLLTASAIRMEEKSNIVEVSGVPEVLPDDRMMDKLLIHFLRPRHGGGEVLRVLYPCYEPGKAFIVYEETQGESSS